MKTCHVCLFECEDDAELCPLCGADLTDKSEENSNENEELEEIVLENPVLLAKFEDLVSGEIFGDILAENNIPYVTTEDSDGSIRVVFGGGFLSQEIFVDNRDFDKALALYEEFLQSEPQFEELDDEAELDDI